MTTTTTNRMAQPRKRGRPPMFSEIPVLPTDTPPPPRSVAPDVTIEYGERCQCGKHPSWLRVREGVKPIADGDSIVRQFACLGCGRKVAVRSPLKRK